MKLFFDVLFLSFAVVYFVFAVMLTVKVWRLKNSTSTGKGRQ